MRPAVRAAGRRPSRLHAARAAAASRRSRLERGRASNGADDACVQATSTRPRVAAGRRAMHSAAAALRPRSAARCRMRWPPRPASVPACVAPAARDNSAVAPGTPCRACHSRGRNGSGFAGAGQRAASSPHTQIASKCMPSAVSGSITSSGAAISCGSNAWPQPDRADEQERPTRAADRRRRRSRQIRRAALAGAARPGAPRCRGPDPASRRARSSSKNSGAHGLGRRAARPVRARAPPPASARRFRDSRGRASLACQVTSPACGTPAWRSVTSSSARAYASWPAHRVRTAQQRAGRRQFGRIDAGREPIEGRGHHRPLQQRSRGRQFVRRRFGRRPASEGRPRHEHAIERAADLRSLASELRHDQGQPLVRPLLQSLRGPACGGFEFVVEVVAFDDVSVERRRPRARPRRTVTRAPWPAIRSTKASCAGVQRSKPTNSTGLSLAGGPTVSEARAGSSQPPCSSQPTEFDGPAGERLDLRACILDQGPDRNAVGMEQVPGTLRQGTESDGNRTGRRSTSRRTICSQTIRP